jgi:hypothetical protein
MVMGGGDTGAGSLEGVLLGGGAEPLLPAAPLPGLGEGPVPPGDGALDPGVLGTPAPLPAPGPPGAALPEGSLGLEDDGAPRSPALVLLGESLMDAEQPAPNRASATIQANRGFFVP